MSLDSVRPPGRVGYKGATYLVVSDTRFRRFYELILHYVCYALHFHIKGWHDFDADLVGLNRLSMESSGPNRVRGDSGSRPNSPVSVDDGQASHAPSIHEQGQVVGGTVDILP